MITVRVIAQDAIVFADMDGPKRHLFLDLVLLLPRAVASQCRTRRLLELRGNGTLRRSSHRWVVQKELDFGVRRTRMSVSWKQRRFDAERRGSEREEETC